MAANQTEQPKSLEVGPGVKAQNPAHGADLLSYSGSIEDFAENGLLEQQTKNFEDLKLSLQPFGLRLDQIWAGYSTRIKGGHPVRNLVALDETKQVCWRKYESQGLGSGQNWLYLKGQKGKLTEWLKLSEVERRKLLQAKGVVLPSDEAETV